MPAPLRKGCAMLRELPLRHGAAIASHPWLVAVLAPAVCILLGAVACLLPTTLGLGFDPAELAAAGSVISRWSRTELALKSGLRFSRRAQRVQDRGGVSQAFCQVLTPYLGRSPKGDRRAPRAPDGLQ